MRSSRSTALVCSEYWRKISTCTTRSSSACCARASSETGPAVAPASEPAPVKPSVRVETVAAFAARDSTFCRNAGIDFSFELGDALLVAIVVGIDIHEPVERLAGFLQSRRAVDRDRRGARARQSISSRGSSPRKHARSFRRAAASRDSWLRGDPFARKVRFLCGLRASIPWSARAAAAPLGSSPARM